MFSDTALQRIQVADTIVTFMNDVADGTTVRFHWSFDPLHRHSLSDDTLTHVRLFCIWVSDMRDSGAAKLIFHGMSDKLSQLYGKRSTVEAVIRQYDSGELPF